MSKLYIVATPIGNLKDITLRALETLKEVDLLLAEDTRVTRKLLSAYEIDVKIATLNQHTTNTSSYLKLLSDGKDIALVSDAGTPGINDPGGKFIEEVLASNIDVEIIPIPGVSALTALLSVAGIQLEHFEYKGFVPHKKGKQTFLTYVNEVKHPVVFFESTHRIIKTLEALKELNPQKKIIIGRELTKLHEIIYRGTVSEVLDHINNSSTKGEFVIITHD